MALDVRTEVRLSVHEREAWKKAAEASGLSLSEWIRSVCNIAVPGEPPEGPLIGLQEEAVWDVPSEEQRRVPAPAPPKPFTPDFK